MRSFSVLLLLVLLPRIAVAQEAWIQIAAENSVERADRVAAQFDGVLPELRLIALGGPWIAVAAGPFPEAEAQALWLALLAEGTIPSDSFLNDGTRYGAVLERDAPQAEPQLATPAPTEVEEPEAPPAAAWERTGITVTGDGAVLVAAAGLSACGGITLGPERSARVLAQDDRLALVYPDNPTGIWAPAALRAAPVPEGAFLFIGVAPDAILSRAGASEDLWLTLETPALQQALGPVFDASGALAGLALPADGGRALAAPTLAAFLADAGVLTSEAPDAPALRPDLLSERAALLTGTVTCLP